MNNITDSQSDLMARLTISALARVSKDPSCWNQPVVYRALLISGLSILVAANQLLDSDLEKNN